MSHFLDCLLSDSLDEKAMRRGLPDQVVAIYWVVVACTEVNSRRNSGMTLAEQTAILLERIRGQNEEALGELFMLFRERLWRMLFVRLDSRLMRRVAPEDVLQETFLDVARRIGEYLADPAVPFYIWL